jgi:hypothetical protein
MFEIEKPVDKAALARDPDKVLPETLEGIRAKLVDVAGESKTQAERLAAIEAASKDVAEVFKAQQETLKDYRDALRRVPEAGETQGKIDLRSASLVEPYRGKRGESLDTIDAQFSRMSRAQFNFTHRPVRSLGLDSASVTARKIERFQALHDALALAQVYLAKTNPHLLQMGWQSLPGADEYMALAVELEGAYRAQFNAMNETNATEGKNWVPSDILSSRILPYIESARVLSSYFESVPMPGPVYTMGVVGSRLKPYKMVENLQDDGATAGADFTVTQWTTKKFQFTAKRVGMAVIATPDWLQDAIVNADYIVRELAAGHERGREDWLINGQATATIDGVVIGSTDIRKVGDGIRYWLNSMSGAGLVTTIDLSAGLTGEAAAKIFGGQGRYAHKAAQSIWLTSNLGLTHALLIKRGGCRGDVLHGPHADDVGSAGGSVGRGFRGDGRVRARSDGRRPDGALSHLHRCDQDRRTSRHAGRLQRALPLPR